MEASTHLELAIFDDLTSVAEEYYARSASIIFEDDEGKSQIKVRIHPSIDASFWDRRGDLRKTFNHSDGAGNDKADSNSDAAGCITSKSGASKREQGSLRQRKERKASNTRLQSDGIATGSNVARYHPVEASSTGQAPTSESHERYTSQSHPDHPDYRKIDLHPSRISGFVKHTERSFRVFSIRQRHSSRRLQITGDSFEELLRSCYIFPRFKEFVTIFGSDNSCLVASPSTPRFHPLCEIQDNSYIGFECSYILHYAEYTNCGGRIHPYFIRPFVVHHRCIPRTTNGCATWILIGSSAQIEEKVDKFTCSTDDLIMKNPFELHLALLNTAISSWLSFLRDIEKIAKQQASHDTSNKASGISAGSDDEAEFIPVTLQDMQEANDIEKLILDNMFCLKLLSDIVVKFMKLYAQFRENHPDAVRILDESQRSMDGTDDIFSEFEARAGEINHFLELAESLFSKAQSTRNQLSALSERQRSYGLYKLMKKRQDVKRTMVELTTTRNRIASNMRTLTIIVVICLSFTIASSFLPPFVNKNQSQTGSMHAQNAYKPFVTSISLSLLMISFWYMWLNYERLVQFRFRRGGMREGGDAEQGDDVVQRPVEQLSR
ncbi:hypothetical protein DM02DRAFT_695243 [Periconia macrospinosa]|uniref:Cora-domain-containing protein n=1 Tax=Periconia macrospinosa TaxID=97972 RepID=A0A2V1D6K6_9PLEO|nr:hypothetical protein DM02DRAFT_695243 [Periconia macrospinosa]